MKYFVGCLGPLNDACQSSIIYIACVYTGYYHAIRLHTFQDWLLYFLILCPFHRHRMPQQRRRRGPGAKCALFFFFFFNFFEFISVNSLEMTNIGELPYGVLGTAPKFESAKKLNLSLCLRPPNNVAKGNFLRWCSYKL